MEIIYKASLDRFSKISTVIAFLLLIPMGFVCTVADTQNEGLIGLIILLSVFFFGYVYSVKSYQIIGEELIINRRFSLLNKKIPLSTIERVKLLDKRDFDWMDKTIGNNGLLGYYGYYSNTKLGSFKVYATNRNNGILLVLKDKQKKIVISPDDPGMADDLQKRLKGPA